MDRGRFALGAATLLAASLLLARYVAFVPDEEMAPSLFPGDILLILPVEPRVGDIVAMADPLDGNRWTLRRVESIGGAASYDGEVVRTADKPKVLLLEMGEYGDLKVRFEDDHLVSRRPQPARSKAAERGVPDDAAYVMADARDQAFDSRWWGPMPLAAFSGVVVGRLGVPHTPWRGWLGFRGERVVLPKSSRLRPAGA